jgi:hypothetical protein
MDGLLRNLASRQGRLISGLAFVVAAFTSGIAIASNATWTTKLAASLPLVATGAAWILAEVSGGAVAHPHDIKLFGRIMACLPDDDRHFLRDQNFANNFDLSRMRGIGEMSYWQVSSVEFLDRKIQQEWRELKDKICEFHRLVVSTTAPLSGNVRLQTVYPKSVDPEDPPERVVKEIDALNRGATQLTELIDAFEPMARRRLFV